MIQNAPPGAMIWADKSAKQHRLREWRQGVGRKFGEAPRVLRVAWTLEWLFTDEGYAFASDSFLARETGLHVDSVSKALTALQRGGAIHRVRTGCGRKAERRIYPMVAVAQEISARLAGEISAKLAGQNPYRTRLAQKFGLTSTMEQARRDAERRAKSACG
jgi:hypothetical protein